MADYIRLYKHSEFHAYAVDLVGTPSSSSRKALVALCKKAYSGSVYDGDSLYPLRMTNAIVKEVAIATAKATALAIFRNPRHTGDASPPPQHTPPRLRHKYRVDRVMSGRNGGPLPDRC